MKEKDLPKRGDHRRIKELVLNHQEYEAILNIDHEPEGLVQN